eukprot:365362-Chlamydomonas_euryale.AAC.20
MSLTWQERRDECVGTFARVHGITTVRWQDHGSLASLHNVPPNCPPITSHVNHAGAPSSCAAQDLPPQPFSAAPVPTREKHLPY